ncbi:MAG: hypothetical protein LC107_04720 [Chitinophagales bacterium]|nr:hypothetical protein [Chitinophagales bacterium]
MMRFFGLFFILGLLLNVGCKSDNKPASPTTQVQDNVDMSSPEIPGVPEEVMLRLINECTFIDYIFSQLPFSLSQDEPPSIKQNILFIDYTKPVGRIPKHCKPDGRKFFQIQGEIVYDVDVYILNGCNFYVFVDKENKPMYANYITPEGMNFYNNTIKQAEGMMK